MTIEIKMTFDNIDAAIAFLSGGAGPVTPAAHDDTQEAPEHVLVITADPEPSQEEAGTAGTKRKRRTKAEMEAAKQAEPVVTETPAPQAQAPVEVKPAAPITKDTIRAKLGEINANKGIDVARQLLQRFGTTSVSGLLESEYASFIAKCDAVIGGADV